MSIDAINWVWDHSQSKNGQRLVLLAIACRADNHGRAWPSISDLQRRTKLSRSAVCDALTALVACGELEIAGNARRGQNIYRLPMPSLGPNSNHDQSRIQTSSDSGLVQNLATTSPESALELVQNPDLTSAESGPHNHQEPSENHQGIIRGAARARGGTRRARPGSGAPDRIAITAALRAQALGYGVPAERITVETERFLDHHRARGSRFQDWTAAWRNWMRNAARFDPTDTARDGLSPLPDEFAPSDAMRRWLAASFPQLDADYETAQFVSHFRATGARRRSWPDAWQAWCRRAAKFAAEQHSAPARTSREDLGGDAHMARFLARHRPRETG